MRAFPDIVADALKYAAEIFGDGPPTDYRH
jgi:hypothetical protein